MRTLLASDRSYIGRTGSDCLCFLEFTASTGVGMRSEDVLHLVWQPGTVLEADDVHAAMAKVNELAAGAEYPMLIDIANTQAVTRQARSVFSVKCAASRIALLGSNPVSRVIANFAMARRTLPCPTRFFTSRDEAMS